MLNAHELLMLAFYSALVLVVPGPTNTLLFSSSLRVGLRRAFPLVIAEAIGYTLAIPAWGFSLLALAEAQPWLLDCIKLSCGGYLLWLGLRLWKRSVGFHDSLPQVVKFREVALATLLNPKAFLFASTIFPSRAFHSFENFIPTVGFFLLVLFPIGAFWVALGKIVTCRDAWSGHAVTFQRLASVALCAFSVSIFYSTRTVQEDLLRQGKTEFLHISHLV